MKTKKRRKPEPLPPLVENPQMEVFAHLKYRLSPANL